MKRANSSTMVSSTIVAVLTVMSIFIAFEIIPLEARNHNTKKSKSHSKHPKDKIGDGHNAPVSGPTQSTLPYNYPNHSNIAFNILSFGAVGDGNTDDSKALEAAWKAACEIQGARVEIPEEFRFLVKPLTLQGPCMPQLVLQIDGTVVAPPDVGAWSKASLFQWLNIKWVHNFTILGSGTIDGQGFHWWNPSNVYYLQKRSKPNPQMKPTALRFYGSNNVTVRDITIVDSPQCHLKFDSSYGIKVDNITISSPETSPNTDGIHLQNTQDVEIQHSNIGCGDDCVSIQTGCSNIHIRHTNCAPGHGISIGALGKDNTAACVSNIVIEDVSLQNTQAGVRIKTWQGGVGSIKNVSFSNIQVSEVEYPIIIDQYYCDNKFCKNQTGAVAISGVKYESIIGTYTIQPLHLACSHNVPCTNIDLIDIQLKPSSSESRDIEQALCWNSYGKTQGPLFPFSIDYCLRNESGSLRRASMSHKHMCSL